MSHNEKWEMLEKIPKSVPIDFGTSHGNELLNFFDTCRRRGIGTDIELTVNGKKLKGISLFIWKLFIEKDQYPFITIAVVQNLPQF